VRYHGYVLGVVSDLLFYDGVHEQPLQVTFLVMRIIWVWIQKLKLALHPYKTRNKNRSDRQIR
jgi:hypothetical protein